MTSATGDRPTQDHLASVQPARLQATLHVAPRQVTAWDLAGIDSDSLTGRVRGSSDRVSLELGDQHARVAVVGSLAEVTEIVTEAATRLAEIAAAREEAGQ